jgi:DNA polymerase elongation subunit (family B)
LLLAKEELLNAQKYGYKFEVLRGYYFEKSINIFKDYITELYNLRLNYPKDHPMNFIAKILMNSLYGRFGMEDNFSYSNIVNNKDFANTINSLSFNKLKLIDDIKEIGTDNKIISTFKDQSDTMLNSLSESHNTNIAIASAITALARVHMSKYKNNDQFNLFYLLKLDTDSLFIDIDPNKMNELYPNSIGNAIGPAY